MTTQYNHGAESYVWSCKFVNTCLYVTYYPGNTAFSFKKCYVILALFNAWWSSWMTQIIFIDMFDCDLLLRRFTIRRKSLYYTTFLCNLDVIMTMVIVVFLMVWSERLPLSSRKVFIGYKWSDGWKRRIDINSVQGYQVNSIFMRAYLWDGYGIVHFDTLLPKSSLNMHRYLV